MSSGLQPCRACQRRVIDAFTSLAGISLHSPRAPIASIVYQSPRQSSTSPTHRLLHTSRQLWTQQPSRPSDAPKLDELVADQPDQPKDTPPTHIPWYLQTTLPSPPTTTSSLPSASLTALPPLPPNSPAILSPLLTHLSLSIGLDSLSILDLRDLSPPSALGANLLMILGTARSEKHLNTSADRFCRWLRTTYKLRPYADGLLGRNELKLKLRRRNKKIKLAQSVGNTVFESQPRDDGITTGWICCNLGAVDGAVIPEAGEGSVAADTEEGELHPRYSVKDQERFLEDEDEYRNPSPESIQEQDFKYAGFGSASYAPRIVVQMFTEEKRVEMDLEGLWEARIRRRDEKDEKRQMKFEEKQQMMEAEEEFETGRIEEEIENPDKREGMRQEKVLGGMAAS